MTSLGESKTVNNLTTYTDYTYDPNGNLTTDKNKDIIGITYNYLNLPQVIATAKGTINFIYDATGSKLKKVVKETGKADKTTLHLFGTYQNEVLQFLPQEEGRVYRLCRTVKLLRFCKNNSSFQSRRGIDKRAMSAFVSCCNTSLYTQRFRFGHPADYRKRHPPTALF